MQADLVEHPDIILTKTRTSPIQIRAVENEVAKAKSRLNFKRQPEQLPPYLSRQRSRQCRRRVVSVEKSQLVVGSPRGWRVGFSPHKCAALLVHHVLGLHSSYQHLPISPCGTDLTLGATPVTIDISNFMPFPLYIIKTHYVESVHHTDFSRSSLFRFRLTVSQRCPRVLDVFPAQKPCDSNSHRVETDSCKEFHDGWRR